MKKLSLALLCALIAVGTAVASNNDTDEPKNETSLAYGTPFNSTNSLEFLAAGFTGGLSNRQLSQDRYVGPISIEYFHRSSPLIGYGAIAVFSHYKGVRNSGDTHKSSYFTIMPAMKVNWLRREQWGLYSKLAFGYTHGESRIIDKDPKVGTISTNIDNINFQASLIGFEAGGDNVRGFAEIGFGEQGAALAGVRFRF